MARGHLRVSHKKMEARFDRKAEKPDLKAGDRVLALLPTLENPLAARF